MSAKGVLEYELADGTPVFVETADARTEEKPQRVTRCGGVPQKIDSRFEEAVARIRPATQILLDNLRDLNTPDQINLEFGLKFSANAGAIIASVDSEATFKVTITWKSQK
jgi:hypothetical protein